MAPSAADESNPPNTLNPSQPLVETLSPPASSDMLGPAQPASSRSGSAEVSPALGTTEVPPDSTVEGGNEVHTGPRVIDENTDLSTLTDQEIMKLMEDMPVDEATSRPLISTPVPLVAIREEYIAGSKQILKKIDWLQEHGWDQVWRARGDGDCFYRSFTLAFILRILHSENVKEAAQLGLKSVTDALPAMQSVGFDADLYEEFLEPLLTLLKSFEVTMPTEWDLIQVLQDPERSNCIVVALRLMTSAYIRTHSDLFEPFLFSPLTYLPLPADDFCRQEVEPCGKEADHAQIMALAEALNVGVRVAYLDRSEIKEGDPINWVEFGKRTGDDHLPLTLLYRPGHFDVVTKDPLVQSHKKETT